MINVHIAVAGYPNFFVDIETPILKEYSFRKHGLTVRVEPEGDKAIISVWKARTILIKVPADLQK